MPENMSIGCALRYTATHTCPRAGGASSLPDALLYLFAPALVQPRPARTGGKRFFTQRKRRHITPVGSCAERAYLCQPKPEDGTKQAAEAQPRHRARVWRHRALPERRRSRPRRAARLEGRLAAAHPDGWRYLQHAETPGTSFLWRKRSGWEATAIRWCVCARPARASLRLPHAR